VLTLAAVADHKGIRFDRAAVHIERHISEGKSWSTDFRIGIELGDHLTPRERKILFNSARLCEVNKMLSGRFNFDYRIL